MGEAKQRNDRLAKNIDRIQRNRAQLLADFVDAYLAAALTEEELVHARANPSAWVAEKMEMVDRVSPDGKTHVVYFRRRGSDA